MVTLVIKLSGHAEFMVVFSVPISILFYYFVSISEVTTEISLESKNLSSFQSRSEVDHDLEISVGQRYIDRK